MSDETTANRFLTALSEAAADPRGRIRIIVTLRADFYDRPLGHAAFGSAMSRGVVNVVPMAPEELERAASKPASIVGVRLEPELEAALIGDVLGQPGALPLFQFALTDLFDRRVGDTLTLVSYRDIGGVDGSVGRKAEHIYEKLTVNQQAAARQIFLRLVSITDIETRSRRRVEAMELLDLDLEVTDLQTVIDLFGKDRLLSFDRNDATGSPTVEVAHEALLEHWQRLADWIEAGSEDVRMNVRLRSAASEWADSEEDPGYLLAGARLGQYETWARTSVVALARTERLYVDASTDLRDATARAEQERQERESAIRRRVKRNALGLAAVVMIVAAVSGFFLWTTIQPEDPTVALVRTSDTDQGVNAMILTGFEKATVDLDFIARNVVILADMESDMRQLAEDGTDLIVVGPGFETFVGEIAPDFLKTTFAIVALPNPYEAENVSVAQFNWQGEVLLVDDNILGSIPNSVAIQYDVAIYTMISAYLDGNLERIMTFDISDGGLNYSD